MQTNKTNLLNRIFPALVAIFLTSSAWAQNSAPEKAPLVLPKTIDLDVCGEILDHSRVSDEAAKRFEDTTREVIGQDQAVGKVLSRVETLRAGLIEPGKPINLIFLGPTGVGKTETAKIVVRALGGEPDANLITIRGENYQSGHEISNLQGAAKSYAGYGDETPLTAENLKKRAIKFELANGSIINLNVVLWDELEKGADQLFKIMLGWLHDGEMANGKDGVVRAKYLLNIITTNLGAAEVEARIKKVIAQLKEQGIEVGDQLNAQNDYTGRFNPELREEYKGFYTNAARVKFSPEFLGRIPYKIQFYHHGPEEYEAILNKKLAYFQRTVINNGAYKVMVKINPSARMYMIANHTDFSGGARGLDPAIESQISDSLASLMTTRQVRDGDVVVVDFKDNMLTWGLFQRDLPPEQITELAESEYPGFSMAKQVSAEIQDEVNPVKELSQDQLKKILLGPLRSVKGAQLTQKAGETTINITTKMVRMNNEIYGVSILPDNKFSLKHYLTWDDVSDSIKRAFPSEAELKDITVTLNEKGEAVWTEGKPADNKPAH